MGQGKRVKLSNGRRLVDEVLRAANKMPLAAYVRDFDLSELAKLRKQVRPRISWNVLYMKAYAIISEQNPVLRQCYVGFPWPSAYQHETNVCLLTMSREYRGEERLLFARFNRPECRSLADLQSQYDDYRKTPVEQIKQFRHQIQFAKAPWFVRRFAWWVLMNLWPRKRASHFGTFGMTISGYKEAFNYQVLSPNTTTLGIDVLPRNGQAKFSLTFDHQILDGVPVINFIDDVYKTLNGAIKEELASMKESGSQSSSLLERPEIEAAQGQQTCRRAS